MVLLLSVAGSGCLSPTIDTVNAVDSSETSMNEADPGGIQFETTGGAFDWVVAYHPLPAPVKSLHLQRTGTFTVAGDGEHVALWSPPWIVFDQSQSPFQLAAGLRDDPSNPFGPANTVAQVGGPYTADRNVTISIGANAGIRGIWFAAAANADWTVRTTVRWAEGALVAPQHVQEGHGATFYASPIRPVVGALLSSTTPLPSPGWSHAEIQLDDLQPVGAYEFQVTLPSGKSYQDPGLAIGYELPVAGSMQARDGRTYHGEFWGPAGDLLVDLTTAYAAQEIQYNVAHLPLLAPLPGSESQSY